jgi:hypothetical protein
MGGQLIFLKKKKEEEEVNDTFVLCFSSPKIQFLTYFT